MSRPSIVKITSVLAMLGLFLSLPNARAFDTPNDVGGHVHINALAPTDVICGKYVRGAENGGHNTDPSSYAYVIDGLIPQVLSNAIDHYWFHDTNGDFVVFDMGSAVSQVILYPAIDHGPVPEEAIEGTIYATNNLADPENTWVVGDISTIYDPGWDAGWIADDWVTVWDLPGSYRYIGVHWDGPKAMIGDGDLEFDALCAQRQHGVPEFDNFLVASMLGLSTLVVGTRIGLLKKKMNK